MEKLNFQTKNESLHFKETMKLPVSISPCPIVEATVDVRFETDVPSDAVFGVVYQSLREEFPKTEALPAASIPAELRRKNPALEYQAHYRLEREGNDLVAHVGPKSIAIGIKGEYPGWKALSGKVLSTLARVVDTKVIRRPVRFGLRYINFVPENIFPNLTLSFALESEPLLGEGTFFKTVIADSHCKLLLQVGRDLFLASDRKKMGSVIDIDAFLQNPPQNEDINASLSGFLNSAHLAEKRLFYRLLKPEFLASLNPTY